MTDSEQQVVAALYKRYNVVIKPLIAEIEARSEKMPLPLFNEIRAFNDHVAHCYLENADSKMVGDELEKAGRHINRITLDCFKCLNVILYEKLEVFERQTRNVDLTVLDNGCFYPEYKRLRKEAASYVKEAKLKEGVCLQEALGNYQEAYKCYVKIDELVDCRTEDVKWAKVRFRVKKVVTVVLWVLSVLLSALVSIWISCDMLPSLF